MAHTTTRPTAKTEKAGGLGLLAVVVNNLPTGAMVVRGSDLRILLVNEACQAITPGKAMVGQTLEEVWPETQPRFGCLCRQVLATGEPYRAVDEPLSIRQSHDGPLEPRCFSWSLVRVRLPGDGGWGLLNTFVDTSPRKRAEEFLRESEGRNLIEYDITGRKRAEEALRQARDELEQRVAERTEELRQANEALRESERRHRILFESSRDAIMTLAPPSWKFTTGNRATIEMFRAKNEAAFVSCEPWTLSPERQPDGRASAEKARAMIETAMREGAHFFEWTHKRIGGEEFPATVLLSRVEQDKTVYLQATVRDITELKRAEQALRQAHDELEQRVVVRTEELRQANEALRVDIIGRKQAEEQVQASLKEKETLLKEIHHRVKNNMQVICSLLSLQSGYVTAANAKTLFRESQHRIRSMAMIHEALYSSQDLAAIDFGAYVRNLAGELMTAYPLVPGAVQVHIDVERITLGIDQAVPCGLILNELISNSLKHAFPHGRQGMIGVEMQRHHRACVLRVRDDGVGIPPAVDVVEPTSFGLRLVRVLATQLCGTVDYDRGAGTSCSIRFEGG